ncbi:MAG: Gfo/Idh/MocA family oxidoreductase [Candidatus Eremiobacteraeota bacterium]|nr:Gfo/Idh/MocA family oxidoreductase [Candidatus Eremiobacteraeota bacterium]
MKRYKIGIVGTGFGVRVHLPALRNHPRFEVIALASPSSAPQAARAANVAHAFRSCAEMVDGIELDAVTIASPPFAHRDDVLVALAHGKHVICEKPFALRVADAQSMVDAQDAAGTACGVAHEFRFVPQAQALKELVVNGHLDPLRNIEITLLRASLRRHDRRSRGWWFERERGGGLTGAVMSHLIDHANWLAGRPPTRMLGFHRTANADRSDERGTFRTDVADGAFALFEYPGGLAARVSADGTTTVESYTCAVHGERRTAVESGPTITDVTLYTVDEDETSELQCKASPYARYARIEENVPPMMELYDEFVKKIEGEPNTLPSFEDALQTQRALAAIGYDV